MGSRVLLVTFGTGVRVLNHLGWLVALHLACDTVELSRIERLYIRLEVDLCDPLATKVEVLFFSAGERDVRM